MKRSAIAFRTLAPTHYGETRAKSDRSLLFLRAWMLWRSRGNGWALRDQGLQNHVDDEASRLEQNVKAIQATGSLLGDLKADDLLKTWVPDIAGRLCDG